jgi:hypothetical protein
MWASKCIGERKSMSRFFLKEKTAVRLVYHEWEKQKVHMAFIVVEVDLTEYPILKTIRGEESVEVFGIIELVEPEGFIRLRDAKLKFLP